MTGLEAQLETVACPVCASERQEPILHAPNRFEPNSGNLFQIVLCSECRCVYLNPRPTPGSISDFYDHSGYDPFLSTQAEPDLWSTLYLRVRNFMVRRKRAWIEAFKPRGTLLDVGCGTGEFLYEMQTHGWQTSGVETESRAAEYARTQYGLDVVSGDLETCEFAPQQFDVVTFWHVLEHLFDPVQTLKKVVRIMNDAGIALIAVPNIACIDARFYKENWVALDAPRHLVHFTPTVMARLAEHVGLEVIRLRQMPLDAFYNCLMSEKLIAARSQNGHFLRPFRMLRGACLAAGSVALASRIVGGKARGSSIFYILRKRESK